MPIDEYDACSTLRFKDHAWLLSLTVFQCHDDKHSHMVFLGPVLNDMNPISSDPRAPVIHFRPWDALISSTNQPSLNSFLRTLSSAEASCFGWTIKTDEGMTAQAEGNPLKGRQRTSWVGGKCRPSPRLALELDSFLIAGEY